MKPLAFGSSLLTSVAVVLTASFAAAQSLEHTKDSLGTVKANVDGGKAVLIDVREPTEWNAGHLAQAILKPLKKLGERGGDPATVMKDVPKEKIVYCHCKAGGRALMAARILKDLGYDVRPLKPGFAELLEAGFPKAKDGT
jgi:rhodanese-related sulfurtransferase